MSRIKMLYILRQKSLVIFSTLVIINLILFSGLFDRDTPVNAIKKYFGALKTMQDHLAIRLLEEFDWTSIGKISQDSITRLYARYQSLRLLHGLIKEFIIVNSSIKTDSSEFDVKIRWDDADEAIDKVKLSNKTGKWKIVSAEIYY